MKKLLLLCLCLCLCLAACGEKMPPETTPPVAEASETSAATILTEELPPVKEPTLYKLSFIGAGDNMAYYGNVRDAKKNAEGTDLVYDFRPSYTDIKPVIADYDLRFINQETLMCGDGFDLSYYPRFNSPQELGDAVVDTGFNIVGLANNHMLDRGESGLLATLDYWDSQPVTRIGAYRSEEDFEKITVIEQNGIRVALLSFTYSTNGIKLPKGSTVYIPYIDNDTIARKVREAEEIADLTVVSMHWGYENTFKPSDAQREVAALIHENGGDVIVGHHPHCIQPVEWIGEGEGRTLCVYSLGNFMSEMAQDYNILGGMIAFDVEKLGENGRASVTNVRFIPTVFDYTRSFYNNHIFLLEDYTDAQAKAHGIAYYGNHTTLDRLVGYVKKTIDAEFLPDFLKSETE